MTKARLVAVAGASALALVAGFEGLRQAPYLDVAGIPTVCYGHTAKVESRWHSLDECDKLLAADLTVAARAVQRHVKVPLRQPTFDALTSFVYNVGEGNFRKSTLLRKLNAGDIAGACNELPRWVYAGGVKSKGLANRRAAEQALCLQGT